MHETIITQYNCTLTKKNLLLLNAISVVSNESEHINTCMKNLDAT